MLRLPIFAIALPALIGCNAQAPEDEMFPEGPDAGAPAGDPDPTPGDDRPSLDVGEVPASTQYGSVPVTGTGPERGTVIVESATESVAADIDADGSFCIDVPLQLGISNTVWFKAMDVEGVYSDEVEVTIRQEGDPPDGENEGDDDTGPEMRNIAQYGEIDMNVDVFEGQIELLNDGDPETFVRLENNEWSPDDYVTIKLTDADAPIDHMRIRSTSDCPIETYYVMMTDEPDPPSPMIPYGPYVEQPWVEVDYITEGTGDDIVEADLQSQPVATHVALLLIDGCTAFTQEFEIQEVEVMTSEGTTPPDVAPQGPTCSSGAF